MPFVKGTRSGRGRESSPSEVLLGNLLDALPSAARAVSNRFSLQEPVGMEIVHT